MITTISAPIPPRRSRLRRLICAISARRCSSPLDTTARSLEAKVTCEDRDRETAFSPTPAEERLVRTRVFLDTSVALERREKKICEKSLREPRG